MIVLLAALLSGCEQHSRISDETSAKLVGTWKRDIETQSGKGSLTLVLRADGKFVETLELAEAGSTPKQVEYAGEWSFDGANFKRRFLQENGRQFSGGSLRFATLELTSVSAKEFHAKDNVRGVEVAYRKVTP